jgi:hypothetical protein
VSGITWDWTEAGRGALCALPGAVIMFTVNVSLGMVFALGTTMVAMLGVPPKRSKRPRLVLVGAAFAAFYALGSVLGLWAVVAVVSLTVLAYAAVQLSTRRPAAKLLTAMLLPGLALGTNHPAPAGLGIAGVFLAGGVWVTIVTYAWPEARPPAVAQATTEHGDDSAHARPTARIYGVLFAAAAGIGLALGYLLDFAHVAWASAAAMFIMRPDPELLASRAIGRTVATFAGVVAAGLLLHRGPTEIALAIVTVAGVAGMVAVRTSRWYVTSAGSGFIVLLVSGISGTAEFQISFIDRIVETAIGAGLALACGIAIPAGLRWLAQQRSPVGPAPQAPGG